MMSPHIPVALLYVSDEEAARRASRRPDAVPDPEELVARPVVQSRMRRRLIRLRLLHDARFTPTG
jgi:hypothetical protein